MVIGRRSWRVLGLRFLVCGFMVCGFMVCGLEPRVWRAFLSLWFFGVGSGPSANLSQNLIGVR